MGRVGEGKGKEGEGKGGREMKEGRGEGRDRARPQVTVEPGPLRALLRHWLESTVATALDK